ncbi:MAG: NAD(P)-binding protein [Deltaproteobacteria bacterium]|nr:NAD(P)-binding protein [Deltaproteobacteria bacterium]
MKADYLIVGSGLTGAILARRLADRGRDVLVLERRAHVGGNVHDHEHPSGIRVHSYGPHFFRTSSGRIWRFANRFASFQRYVNEVRTLVDGRYEQWPVAGSYVRRVAGTAWRPRRHHPLRNFEEAALAMMPRVVYEKFVKGYTEKQWGVPARCLDASLASRFEVRWDDDRRLKRSRYQGLPVEGYASFMRKLLEGIRVIPNCDYLEHRRAFSARKLLAYTGPIDAWFDHDLGRLVYRGQRREHEYLLERRLEQPAAVVNNPDPAAGPHVRTIEWKHLMSADAADHVRGTVLTREIPITPSDPDAFEYPFQNAANQALYQRYRLRAEQTPRLLVCGRLGEYRYYDMDQAIARALALSQRILAAESIELGIRTRPLSCGSSPSSES